MGVLTVNSRKARSDFRDILDRVFFGNSDVVIERHGKPMAVLIPIEDYEELQDELEDLRAARRAAEIYEDWMADNTHARSMEDIEADLIARGLLDG